MPQLRFRCTFASAKPIAYTFPKSAVMVTFPCGQRVFRRPYGEAGWPLTAGLQPDICTFSYFLAHGWDVCSPVVSRCLADGRNVLALLQSTLTPTGWKASKASVSFWLLLTNAFSIWNVSSSSSKYRLKTHFWNTIAIYWESNDYKIRFPFATKNGLLRWRYLSYWDSTRALSWHDKALIHLPSRLNLGAKGTLSVLTHRKSEPKQAF